MFNTQIFRSRTNILARRWAAGVRAAGGGFEINSLTIANSFAGVIVRKSYYPKIKYLLPMLGAGIGAARVPLIDPTGAGACSNTNFVDADFTQSTGLQGNGSNKWLDSALKPGQLGTSNNGAYGWWENNINLSGNVEPMGCYGSGDRYVIDLRSLFRVYSWGSFGNNAGQVMAATNGHYYGQRISATNRSLYFNGSFLGTNGNNDTATTANDSTIRFVGSNGGDPAWPGRCAMAYLTDGTMTVDEISDFDATLRAYLLGPTGKPTS